MADRFQIHLITDRKSANGSSPISVSRAALRGGIDWVQLRDKAAPARETFEATRAIATHTRRAGAGLLVNDRLDVAMAAGADGVHLAAKSLPPDAARALLGEGPLLGISVHELGEAREAVEAGVDYVTFGHVYPTSSKPGLPPRGILELAEIVESVEVPVLAVGGIDTRNVREVLKTGCAGVAVISAIGGAPDPEPAARKFRRTLDDSGLSPRRPFKGLSQRGAT
ncbi:MAG: thiamine phosphate synthase [Actinomycetota bacterium]|nr:thiamine phosphate synthase [Actinomycetota bacterium]